VVEDGVSGARGGAPFGHWLLDGDRLVRRWRRTGNVEAKSQKGRSRSPLTAHTEWLLSWVGERADLTLEEIHLLLDERGVRVAVSSIWRFFAGHGISFKSKTVHAAEQQRPDVAAARQVWHSLQPQLDPWRLVLIDETGNATNMARRYGRCRRGTRLIGRVPHRHWKSTTFVTGLLRRKADGFQPARQPQGVERHGHRGLSDPKRSPKLFCGRSDFGGFDLGRAEFELGDLAERVELRVG